MFFVFYQIISRLCLIKTIMALIVQWLIRDNGLIVKAFTWCCVSYTGKLYIGWPEWTMYCGLYWSIEFSCFICCWLLGSANGVFDSTWFLVSWRCYTEKTMKVSIAIQEISYHNKNTTSYWFWKTKITCIKYFKVCSCLRGRIVGTKHVSLLKYKFCKKPGKLMHRRKI